MLGVAEADARPALAGAAVREGVAVTAASANVGEGRVTRIKAALAAATAEAPAVEAGWAEAGKVVAAAAARARGAGRSESILPWDNRPSSSSTITTTTAAAAAVPPPVPPLRSVSFTHVVNPFRANSVEHRRAQALTLASIEAARRAAAARGVCVQLIAAVFPEDRGVTAESNAAVSAAVAAVNVADQSATEEVGAAAASCELRPALEVEITGSLSEGLPGAPASILTYYLTILLHLLCY